MALMALGLEEDASERGMIGFRSKQRRGEPYRQSRREVDAGGIYVEAIPTVPRTSWQHGGVEAIPSSNRARVHGEQAIVTIYNGAIP
ncbi:hypothetical protein E2562_007920 [Oryza meyeriana var. granulata]|uniref:Uncharacterized protein n=1 Tax=Oryza meyeriana var. granulata TaxID=110450 RepID=A0A6G1DVI8_9ORYZ|nr:hypothetical protein E2562_007920 [Oryza meyeriana var. granulata]